MRNLIHELVTHYGALRKQLMRELKDPHHAADIAQASFERVYVQTLSTHAVEGDGAADGDKARIESPRALLFRVARNLCIDEARKRKVAHDWVDRHADGGLVQTVPSSEYVAAQRQLLARVIETLERLPPRRRNVFVMFRAHGYTRAEIAARLNITEMAVAKHLVRATIDCSRTLSELRADMMEPEQAVSNRSGFAPRMADDFS